VNELQEAIDWYGTAVEVAEGDVCLRALEQRSNLRVRKAWETLAAARGLPRSGRSRRTRAGKTTRLERVIEAARAEILAAKKDLDKLMAFRETVERASLCGSAMKRLAMVEDVAGRPREERRAIEEMQRYYKLADKRCVENGLPNRFYPAGNYIVAELALHAGERGWRLPDRSLLRVTRESLHDKSAHDPDFWSVVGEIDIDLYEALEAMKLADVRGALEARYQDLYTRMRGGSDWASVYDTATFVLAKYRERATPPERDAADALLAKLRGFVPPPAGRKPPAGRRRAARRRRAAVSRSV
jgi:hypothetical protein